MSSKSPLIIIIIIADKKNNELKNIYVYINNVLILKEGLHTCRNTKSLLAISSSATLTACENVRISRERLSVFFFIRCIFSPSSAASRAILASSCFSRNCLTSANSSRICFSACCLWFCPDAQQTSRTTHVWDPVLTSADFSQQVIVLRLRFLGMLKCSCDVSGCEAF